MVDWTYCACVGVVYSPRSAPHICAFYHLISDYIISMTICCRGFVFEIHRYEASRAFMDGGFDGLKQYIEGLLDRNAISHMLVVKAKA